MKRPALALCFSLFAVTVLSAQKPRSAFLENAPASMFRLRAQINNGGSGGGAQTPTSVNGTTAGVFNPGTFNQPFLFSITGGTSCNPNTAINPGGGTTRWNDALSGCANIPASGVTDGFTDGVAGYVINNNPNSTGQFGAVNGVGVLGACVIAANSAKCEGIVGQAADQAGNTNSVILGSEVDVGTNNNSSTGFGYYLQFSGTGQPVNDTFPAYYVAAPQNSGAVTSGYKCADGSIASNTFNCVSLGQRATGTAQNSQNITFTARAAGAAFSRLINLNQDDVLGMSSQGPAILNGGGTVEAYSVGMTATAALPQNTLVKVGVNSDSTVICTTTDVTCLGFVTGTNNASGLCTIGGSFCPVATTSGSRVQGILGTGTCAIGNFIIVDTTTNGRVKCTATAPPANAMIGIAVSAQAVVGSLVDLIMTGQPQSSVGATGLGAVNVTAQTAAIGTSTLCAANTAACSPAGQYNLQWSFIEDGTACGTPGTGGVTFLLTWTDDNGTAHTAVSLGMDDASAINAVSQTFHFQTTLGAAFASGNFTFSSNGSIMQYATGYTACGVGTGSYRLKATVSRIQ